MSGNSNLDVWIAGAFAAFTVDLLIFPLDTIKTRIQSPDYRKLYVHQCSNTVNRAALFRGLYQGLGSVILATLPASGAFFTTYEGTKTVLTRVTTRSSSSSGSYLAQPIIQSVASGVAELISCAILTPAEVIKQNAQMIKTPSSSNSSSLSSASLSRQGQGQQTTATVQVLQKFKSNPLALWRGYGALATRNLPHTAIQFPIYERFKASLKSWRADSVGRRAQDLSLFENGVITGSAAGSAGCIAAVLTTPVDVVKTRIMLEAGKARQSDRTSGSGSSASNGKSSSTTGSASRNGKGSISGNESDKGRIQGKRSSITIAREIVADSGWKGLWRGGALRGVWTMFGAGLYLGVYETGRVYLGGDRDDIEVA